MNGLLRRIILLMIRLLFYNKKEELIKKIIMLNYHVRIRSLCKLNISIE